METKKIEAKLKYGTDRRDKALRKKPDSFVEVSLDLFSIQLQKKMKSKIKKKLRKPKNEIY